MAYLANEDRREMIIDATVHVIAQMGLPKATTRRIAEQAESSLGALHYCFRGKDDLLAAVLERIRRTMDASFLDIDPEQGFDATVRALADSYWHWLRENMGLHLAIAELVMWEMRREKPGKRLYAKLNRSFGGDLLRSSMQRAAEVDGFEPAVPIDELARFIVHRFDGMTFEYAQSADAVACGRQVDLLVDAVLCLAGRGR